MYPDSVIRKTGQGWKIQVGFWLMVAGGFLMFAVELFIDSDEFYSLLSIGLLMSFIGIVFLMSTVHCPKCKANWIWMAASKRGITEKWGKGLLMLTDCPECNKDEQDA